MIFYEVWAFLVEIEAERIFFCKLGTGKGGVDNYSGEMLETIVRAKKCHSTIHFQNEWEGLNNSERIALGMQFSMMTTEKFERIEMNQLILTKKVTKKRKKSTQKKHDYALGLKAGETDTYKLPDKVQQEFLNSDKDEDEASNRHSSDGQWCRRWIYVYVKKEEDSDLDFDDFDRCLSACSVFLNPASVHFRRLNEMNLL